MHHFNWNKWADISDNHTFARIQWLTLIVIFILITLHFIFRRELGDLEVFYRAGNRFLAEEYLYKLDEYPLTFKYFPANAIIFAGLAFFPFTIAGAIWYFLVAISGWLSINLCFKLAKEEPNTKIHFIYYLSIIGLIGSFWIQELILGQVNIIMFYALLKSTTAIRENKPKESALWWNLAFFIKPYALLFLPYYFWKKKYKVFQYSLILFIIIFFLPALRYGFWEFIELVQGIQKTAGDSSSVVSTDYHNASLFGLFSKLGIRNYSHIKILAYSLGIIISIIFAKWSYNQKAKSQISAEVAILCLLIPLFSPQGWNYIFWCAMPGMVWVWTRWKYWSVSLKIMLIFIFFNIGGIQYEILRRELYYQYQYSPLLPLSMVLFVLLLMYLSTKFDQLTNKKALSLV